MAEIPAFEETQDRLDNIIERALDVPQNIPAEDYAALLADEARQDIFSGAPDDPQRQLVLYSYALAGLDRAASAFSDIANNENTEAGKRKARIDRAIQAFIDNMHISQNLSNALNDFYDRTDNLIKESRALIHDVQDEADTLDDKIDKKAASGDITEEDAAKYKAVTKDAKETATKLETKTQELAEKKNYFKDTIDPLIKLLPPKGQQAVTNMIEAGKDAIIVKKDIEGIDAKFHILHKDENDQLYIIDPNNDDPATNRTYIEDQETIDFAQQAEKTGKKFGNQLPPESIRQFNQAQQEMGKLIQSGEIDIPPEQVEKIGQELYEMQKLSTEVEYLKQHLETLRLEMQDINHKLDNASLSAERREELEQQQAALNAQQTENVKELQTKTSELITQRKGIMEEFSSMSKNDLEERTRNLEEKEDFVHEIKESINTRLKDNQDRHDIMKEKFSSPVGDASRSVIRGVGGLFGMEETSAENMALLKKIVEGEDLSFSEKTKATILRTTGIINDEIIAGWKDTIKTNIDGTWYDVHRDNETGEFFASNDDGKTKLEITDPNSRLIILDQYVSGKAVKNESPTSAHFAETLKNVEANSTRIKEQTIKAVDSIIREIDLESALAREELAQRQDYIQALDHKISTIKLECSAPTDYHFDQATSQPSSKQSFVEAVTGLKQDPAILPEPSLTNGFSTAATSTPAEQAPATKTETPVAGAEEKEPTSYGVLKSDAKPL